MSDKTLLAILKDQQELSFKIMENGGEINSILEFDLDTTAELMSKKVDGYFYVISDLESKKDFFEKMEKEAAAAKKACEASVKSIKNHVKEKMVEFSVNELKGEAVRYVTSLSAPSLETVDEALIPAKYSREEVVVSVDKNAIKDDLDKGIEVPGVKLIQGHTLKKYMNTKKLEGKKK